MEISYIPGIAELDQRLYSHYLDMLASVQASTAIRWAIAFSSTVATECFVLGLMMKGRRFGTVAKAGFVANLSTHPIFWYLLTGIEYNYALWTVTLEVVIAGVEALILLKMLGDIRLRDALVLSLAANGASFFFGLVDGVG